MLKWSQCTQHLVVVGDGLGLCLLWWRVGLDRGVWDLREYVVVEECGLIVLKLVCGLVFWRCVPVVVFCVVGLELGHKILERF